MVSKITWLSVLGPRLITSIVSAAEAVGLYVNDATSARLQRLLYIIPNKGRIQKQCRKFFKSEGIVLCWKTEVSY